MLPAYVSNSSAALFGGGRPIDFNKLFRGRRILGNGKTWRGFIIGIIFGVIIGFVQINAGLKLPILEVVPVISLSFGALIGDIIETFLKRRIGIDRGRPLPLADQLDFVFGAWLFALIFANDWFFLYFIGRPEIILCILIITPFLHITFNILAYLAKIKKVPW